MKTSSIDQELESLKAVLHAVEPLDEKQQCFILKTVVDRLGIVIPAGAVQPSHQLRCGGGAPGNAGSTLSSENASLDGQTPNQFLKAKSPKTDVQRVTCLAYYLTHARGQPHFRTEDFTKINNEARGTHISNPSMSVNNATSQNKYLAPVGEGKKQITTLGEEVVEALPDQDAVREVLGRHRKPRKTKKAGRVAR